MRSVKLAAETLDRYYSTADWVDRVDITCLDLTSSRDCVLGQLFGHFNTGDDEVFANTQRFRAIFGFAPFPLLRRRAERAWADEIRLRRIRRQVAVMEADNIVAREYNQMLRNRVRKPQR